MANKFIINNGNFILGDVEYHRRLAEDHSTTKGGGWFHIDEKNKILYLYSESMDFGKASEANIIDAFENGLYAPSLEGFKVLHSTSDDLSLAMKNNEVIIESIKAY